MPNLNQKGSPRFGEAGLAHILVLLILLMGLVVGLYLVTHPTVFKPKAGGGGTRIEFVNDQGEIISGTTSRDVKIKLTYVPPTSASPISNISTNPNVYVLEINPNDIEGQGFLKMFNATKLFYQRYSDSYNFMAFFFGYEPSTEIARIGKHQTIQNNIRGICQPILGSDPNLWGSSKLQGIHIYPYDQNDYRYFRDSPNFTAKLLGEETAHQWLVSIGQPTSLITKSVFDPSGNLVESPPLPDGVNKSCFEDTMPLLLPEDNLHWAEGLQMPPGNFGVMREAQPWVDNRDGTYSTDANLKPVIGFDGTPTKFHPFDLYLMGLAGKSEITDSYLLLSNMQYLVKGTVKTVKADAQRVAIDNIIRIAGEPRNPDAAHSQKDFKIAFVILTKQGEQPPQALLDNITTEANAFPGQWAYATDNRSTMNKDDIAQVSPSLSSPLETVFPTHFRVANDSLDNLSTAQEQDFNANDKIIPWTLSEGNGEKTVYAQFKVNGVWQQPISASILLKSVTTTPIPVTSGVSFTLETDKNSYGVGDQIMVKVLVHSDIDPANLFAAKMTYDKNLLRLDSIKHDGFIENWVEQYSNQDTGEISLVGGVPNPGFKTTVDTPGVMAYLYFTAIGAGATSIDFTDKSAIYRNSDNVNILASAEGVSFQIGKTTSSPSPEPTESPTFTPKPTPTTSSTPEPVCPLAGVPILENLCPPLPTPEPTPKSSPSSGTAGSGDGNGDGKIDLTDLSMLLTNYNKTSGFPPALDVYPVSGGDSKINAFDFSQMLNILRNNGIIH